MFFGLFSKSPIVVRWKLISLDIERVIEVHVCLKCHMTVWRRGFGIFLDGQGYLGDDFMFENPTIEDVLVSTLTTIPTPLGDKRTG